jgi:2-keto-4-pentenoate hydratase/2-oxohepta-3-ene-1,7-dioic acid hydratase in catechol pathway
MFAVGTFADEERTFAGLVVGEERVLPLPETVLDLVRDWDRSLDRLADLADRGDQGDWRQVGDLRVLPPVQPVQVLQSGANYHKHVLDLIVAEERQRGDLDEAQARAMGERIMDARAATGEPYVFLGSPAALSGAHDDVVLPAQGEQHDWELELAAVLTAGERGAGVAGYLIVNDLTTRDLVYRPDLKAIGTDWLRAKNAPTFLPAGPWIVPAAFVEDPMDLRITLRLNGAVMQDESTSDMIFDLERLVAYVDDRVAVQPGDLLLTGSPAGNGMHHGRFLQAGDVMESEITGLGRQRNRCTR